MEHSYSGKFGSESQIFRNKTKTYHAAAGEIRRYREQTVRLNAYRVSPVNNRSYAVTEPKGHFASGRMEDSILNLTNILHFVQNVRQKEHHIPCCRRRIGLSAGETSGLRTHRVSRVIDTTYAVAHPKGNFASGRAEDSILFHKNFARSAEFL